MLTHIQIHGFALIEHLDLELDAGLTALTGETGAGKSIVVDALGLALGDRSDASIIRHGAARAEIALVFDIRNMPALQLRLAELDLAADDECLIRRSVTLEGRSKAHINGSLVPLQVLKEIGNMLVDIHGQHEHQSLLHRDVQQQLLDDFGGLGTLAAQVAQTYQRWKTLHAEQHALHAAAQDRAARLDLLRYQTAELDTLKLVQGELQQLEQEHVRLTHSEQFLDTCRRSLLSLDDDEPSITALLSRVIRELDALRLQDASMTSISEMLDSAKIQIDEAIGELRHYVDRLEVDPQQLQSLETRLGTIYDIGRKYRVSPAELPVLHEQLLNSLHDLDSADQRLTTIDQELSDISQTYRRQAKELSLQRGISAKRLAPKIIEIIRQLGLPGGELKINLEPQDESNFSANGMERVEFLVSANPGQPLRPLQKVASGGELSRISLAIQVITASSNRIPTLIFDEVDTGVGGRVAEMIGQQLRALGNTHQVLCVTHLPQVAALGHQHFQVAKQVTKNITATQIKKLTLNERKDEIARMLGGIEITQQTLAHAEEMVLRGQAQT